MKNFLSNILCFRLVSGYSLEVPSTNFGDSEFWTFRLETWHNKKDAKPIKSSQPIQQVVILYLIFSRDSRIASNEFLTFIFHSLYSYKTSKQNSAITIFFFKFLNCIIKLNRICHYCDFFIPGVTCILQICATYRSVFTEPSRYRKLWKEYF